MSSLKNKIVWITGASSGIGEALTKALHQEGCKLVISARRIDELERVKQQCSASDEQIKILPIDLTNQDELKAKAAEAERLFGQIDILINNGGISQRALAEETDLSVDRRIMEVNYFGAIALTKYTLPGMIKRKSGHQVVISSVAGVLGTPLRTAYCGSKHAVQGFYNSLRAEIKKYNITTTIISPGFIQTNITVNALTGDGNKFNKMGEAQEKGIPVDACAARIVKAIKNKEAQVFIAGSKEHFGRFIFKFFPALYRSFINKIKNT